MKEKAPHHAYTHTHPRNWFVSHGFLGLLSYTAQNHLPRVAAPTVARAPPHQSRKCRTGLPQTI